MESFAKLQQIDCGWKSRPPEIARASAEADPSADSSRRKSSTLSSNSPAGFQSSLDNPASAAREHSQHCVSAKRRSCPKNHSRRLPAAKTSALHFRKRE